VEHLALGGVFSRVRAWRSVYHVKISVLDFRIDLKDISHPYLDESKLDPGHAYVQRCHDGRLSSQTWPASVLESAAISNKSQALVDVEVKEEQSS
jgi:hypothetical protein